MQKYLQYHTLKEKGLLHFDAWASTFGETVTAIELAPEGTGYRSKTRFAKFIGQIMTSKSPVRSAEDIDETALSYCRDQGTVFRKSSDQGENGLRY